MTAYILAAGKGTRIAPYGETRPKTLIPVANSPILTTILGSARAGGIDRIVLAVGREFLTDIQALAGDQPDIEIAVVEQTTGTAMTLLNVLADEESAVVLYGDVLLDRADVESLVAAAKDEKAAVLLAPVPEEETGDWILASMADGAVERFVGHAREGATHRIAGFAIPPGFRRWLEQCPTHFPSVEVGMMPPAEHHLEAAMEVFRENGNAVAAVVTEAGTLDLDKPWHILIANRVVADRVCAAVTKDELGTGASIDSTASIEGHVRLGSGSSIGRNVIVRGNLVVGENTRIDAGAILNGNAVIGDNCLVANGCFVESGSVIGDECVVNHAAELDGVLFRGVYLYHYMEIYGIVGERTDIGAGTVCGSLRFDDGRTVHKVKGRRERPEYFANATFIGDYCRTGVNATIMPGKKIGPYSVVGAGVLLEEDLPPRTGVRAIQTQKTFAWGPERYGW